MKSRCELLRVGVVQRPGRPSVNAVFLSHTILTDTWKGRQRHSRHMWPSSKSGPFHTPVYSLSYHHIIKIYWANNHLRPTDGAKQPVIKSCRGLRWFRASVSEKWTERVIPEFACVCVCVCSCVRKCVAPITASVKEVDSQRENINPISPAV